MLKHLLDKKDGTHSYNIEDFISHYNNLVQKRKNIHQVIHLHKDISSGIDRLLQKLGSLTQENLIMFLLDDTCKIASSTDVVVIEDTRVSSSCF